MAAMRFALLTAGAVVLSACATQPEAGGGNGAGAQPVAQGGRCDADAAQTVVGQPYAEALREQALKQSGARMVRVIRPGMAVTMDYREDRLNLELDEKDVVVSARCG